MTLKQTHMIQDNIKPAVAILQDVVGPIFTAVMFVATFVLDAVKSIDSLLVEIPVAILVLSMAAFYFARLRKVWAEGTHLNDQNKRDRNERH